MGQSQRDKLIYRRRLRAAGMQGPRTAKDMPQPVAKAQFKVLQAQQRADAAATAARQAALEVLEANELLSEAKQELDKAKREAAAGLGANAAPPAQLPAELWSELGKLTELVGKLVSPPTEGEAPPDTQAIKSSFDKLQGFQSCAACRA